MTSHNIHGVTQIELREIYTVPNGGFYRTIYIFGRDGTRHDITLFTDGTSADALRLDIEKGTAE